MMLSLDFLTSEKSWIFQITESDCEMTLVTLKVSLIYKVIGT